MRLSTIGGALLALMVVMWSGLAAAAAGDAPTAVNLIFEKKHLSNVEQGKEIDYRFDRSVSDTKLLGEAFTDSITLKVVAAKPTGEKDVDLQIYSGERARDLQKLPGLTINPIFIVYFDQAVASYSNLAGAKLPYLRNAFSLALRDKSKVKPVKVDYKGKTIDAYRISMDPYVGDQNASKMQGWEGAHHVLVLSDQVPGEIVDLLSTYKNKYKGNEKLKLVERITLDGVTGLDGVELDGVE
jgi:hypothetical protein